MNYLLYVSIATIDFTEPELDGLLAQARRKNEAAGVTGMLLFKAGTFMQILEGDEKALHALHLRIFRDPRHRNIVILSEGRLAHREFPDWSMGFERIDPGTSPADEGFVPLSEVATEQFPHPGDIQRALRLLRRFAES